MSNSPFSLMVGGSNDVGLEKMFPISICIFDATFNRIMIKFFDMNMLERERRKHRRVYVYKH